MFAWTSIRLRKTEGHPTTTARRAGIRSRPGGAAHGGGHQADRGDRCCSTIGAEHTGHRPPLRADGHPGRRRKGARPTTKAAKKKAARKRSTKAADGEIVAKRAVAYLGMEPNLRDCEKLARLAGRLSLDHDRDLYGYVVHQAAEKMEKLVADYYALDFPV
jgi:hypothetical protein